MRGCKTKRTDEKLWERIKEQVKWKYPIRGKWSARKSQLAVKLYKKRGGKYLGKRCKNNKLTKWTREDWNYISRSGKGRYLPKYVREQLTEREKRRENRRKGSKKGKWISYSDSVRRKFRKSR